MDVFDDVQGEITCTAFCAVVRANEPFCFSRCVTQDTQASLHLSHLHYTPPLTLEEWETYRTTQSHRASDIDSTSVISVAAKVRTITVDSTIEVFSIATFPLHSQRVCHLDAELRRSAGKCNHEQPSSAHTPHTVVLPPYKPGVVVALPEPSDIVANLDIRLDLDGFVELVVDGPGQVTFWGEQFSALMPEWMNHGMFTVGSDDEEMSENSDAMTEDDLYQLLRLAR